MTNVAKYSSDIVNITVSQLCYMNLISLIFYTVIGSHQHALHRQMLLCDNDCCKSFCTPAFAVIELS